MRLFFFHGLHIPELLPGLEDPLPEGTVEVTPERPETPPIRGAGSTHTERRRDEE